jgi:methionine synthase II (cobalamin-independent)
MTPAYIAEEAVSLLAAAVVSLDLSTCTHAEQRRAEIARVFTRSMDGFMSDDPCGRMMSIGIRSAI